MDVLDTPQPNPFQRPVAYAGFWIRFGALFIDGIILSPVTFGIMYMNVTSWKSPLILILSSLVGLAYKPLLEFYYGATWGKMALKIKVVNLEYEKANLQEILLRNIFHITFTVIVLLVTIGIYASPGFEDVTGFMEYSTYTQQFTALQITNVASGGITLIDAIMLAVDQQKRSLHDRIGKTYVIEL